MKFIKNIFNINDEREKKDVHKLIFHYPNKEKYVGMLFIILHIVINL